MNILKQAILAFIRLLKRLWSLPTIISDAARQRQHRNCLAKLEVERLDRIRDPEKYRGK